MDTLTMLDTASFPKLYSEHIEMDFPINERPPLGAMQNLMERGICRAWLLVHDGEEVAYAIDAIEGRDVLITHLAVCQGKRGGGIGTALLGCLRRQFAAYDSILIEVENPAGAKGDAERDLRGRRIAFYRRAGFLSIPDVAYSLFGVDMLLMALPLCAEKEAIFARVIPVMQALYGKMLPPNLMDEVRLVRC